MWLTADAAGFAPYCQFQGLSLDTCRIGVQIDAANSNPGIQFTSSFIANEQTPPTLSPGGASVVISGTFASHVRFTNGAAWGFSPSVLISGNGDVVFSDFAFNDSGTPASVTISGAGHARFANCVFYNTTGASPYVLDATGGNLTLIGCDFQKAASQVHVGGSVLKAVFVGNKALRGLGGFVTIPPSGPNIMSGLNF